MWCGMPICVMHAAVCRYCGIFTCVLHESACGCGRRRRDAGHGSERGDADEWTRHGPSEADGFQPLGPDLDQSDGRRDNWRAEIQEWGTSGSGDLPPRWPPECPRWVRVPCEYFEDARRWFEAWCGKNRVSEGDRFSYDTTNLIEMLCLPGTYDQLSLRDWASLELVTRRLVAAIKHEANGEGWNIWPAVRYLITRPAPVDSVSHQCRRQFAPARTLPGQEILDSMRRAAAWCQCCERSTRWI